MATATLTLASASPRRKHLLERMGFQVRVVPAHLDERLEPGEQPEDFTKRMARSKVLAAVRRLQATQYTADADANRSTGPIPEPSARWVVGADTVVVVDDLILGKPEDVQEAREMLLRLAGRQHRVITGFCLFDMARNKEGLQAVTTQVTFKPMTRAEIDRYVQAGESMDKAGAYAIQGVGAYLAEHIEGSYTNVVGLPLCQVVEMMQEMGAGDVLPF
jgi:septum formation protein